MTSLLQVEQFFLEAAEHTWAAGMEKSTIPELPGSKVLRYARGGLLYVDTYWGSGERSFGQTLIYESENPLWMMQYYGEYPKRITPFLKQALLAQYRTRHFNGGRGPTTYCHPDDKTNPLEYRNVVEDESRFFAFRGKEQVCLRLTGEMLGWHRYAGLILRSPFTFE